MSKPDILNPKAKMTYITIAIFFLIMVIIYVVTRIREDFTLKETFNQDDTLKINTNRGFNVLLNRNLHLLNYINHVEKNSQVFQKNENMKDISKVKLKIQEQIVDISRKINDCDS